MNFITLAKKVLGRLRERNLGDLDQKELEKIDKTLSMPTVLENVEEIINSQKLCPSCSSEKLWMVNPPVIMNGKSLFECLDCGERCYRITIISD